MTPPNRTPAAPPAPFIAAHRAIARCRSGPAANVEVMIASEQAAMPAPPSPCRARARIRTPLVGAVPPISDASAKVNSARANVRRWPNTSAARPASIRKPAKAIA